MKVYIRKDCNFKYPVSPGFIYSIEAKPFKEITPEGDLAEAYVEISSFTKDEVPFTLSTLELTKPRTVKLGFDNDTKYIIIATTNAEVSVDTVLPSFKPSYI